MWVSESLSGDVHNLTAAGIWGIIRELGTLGQLTLADKGHAGTRVTGQCRDARDDPEAGREEFTYATPSADRPPGRVPATCGC